MSSTRINEDEYNLRANVTGKQVKSYRYEYATTHLIGKVNVLYRTSPILTLEINHIGVTSVIKVVLDIPF